MRGSIRSLQGAAFGLRRLPSLRFGMWPSLDGKGRARAASQPIETYVSAIWQFLAVFRFLSFAMGVGLAYTLNLTDQPLVKQALLIGVVGLYNMARVIWRFSPGAYTTAVSWLALASDAALSVILVLLTGGLDSAFLIYSLAPILTASLIMDARSAIAVAAVSGISISGAYIAAGLGIGTFQWILSGNYLAFSLLYVAVCLFIAYLPFLANLNWQRRVRVRLDG